MVLPAFILCPFDKSRLHVSLLCDQDFTVSMRVCTSTETHNVCVCVARRKKQSFHFFACKGESLHTNIMGY